jgi:hypothetical protein
MKDIEHLIDNKLFVDRAIVHSMDVVLISIAAYGCSMRNLEGAGIDSCPCIDRVRAEGVKGQLVEKPYFCPYFHIPGIGFWTRRDKVADFIKLLFRAHYLVFKWQNIFKDIKVILSRNTCHIYDESGRELLYIVIKNMNIYYKSGIHTEAGEHKEDFFHVFCGKNF